MKILFVTPLYPPEIGGPATYAQLLMDELPKRGHYITLIKFSDFSMLPSGIRHFAIFWKILMMGNSHDVIFAQDVFSVGFPAAVAAKIIRKPLVVRVPGDYAWEQGTQRFGVHDSIDEFQQKKYSGQVEFMRRVQKFVVRSAKSVIAPSAYFANLVQGWLPKKAKKVVAIYNGIDTAKISPYQKTDYGTGEMKTIIAAGRLVPWKEFGPLIKLLARHAAWQLVLVGNGPEKNRLKAMAASLNLTERVHFKGSLTQEKLWEAIAHSDVFVLNSSFESFSFQTVEAMALGTPVIATTACNMQEIITHEQTGILIPAKNDELLERALVQVLGNQAMRDNVGHGGMKRAMDFSIGKTMDKLVAVLESAVQK